MNANRKDGNREGAGRTILVTGASAGLGVQFARQFARHGFDLVLTARRKDRLEALALELSNRHGVGCELVPADLSDPAAPAALCRELNDRGLEMDGVVNNAGYGIPVPFHTTPWEKQRDFIQVLMTTPAELLHRLLPGMRLRRYGRILNVASLAGLVPGASGYTLYGGAKSFVIKMSEPLWLENEGTGVHVTAVCPGFTYTEFHDVAGIRKEVSRLPGIMWMDAETVARQGYRAVMENRPVLVNGRFNRLIALAARYMPEPLVRRVARRSRDYAPR